MHVWFGGCVKKIVVMLPLIKRQPIPCATLIESICEGIYSQFVTKSVVLKFSVFPS